MSTPTNINKILIERPSQDHLDNLGVSNWPIWTKEVSEFPWTYDEPETCYLLEGEVVVTPDGGEPVQIAKGDLVTFPAGMSCTWKIISNVRKHYQFG
ncbi:MAG: cupin domain-containing protein [Moorea sp. SIOASIH]|uniref:cupin domain-containing protein n=1 Tax=Moorena sp. SIOASIH TaxID=2607817 RepID=UPI0013BB24AD|nr:cupin domain-containing protein [Moorena sp. SIOASIH]NEO37009.1 cupin domain-containing protein [Moorena sp. SIOASIH]NEO91900.1 cupin domain-containing protein [Moorena sp. SIO3G5]